MTVDNLVTFVRDQAKGIGSDNVSNATIASYLTIARNIIIERLARNKHLPLNRDIFETDTVQDQSEYTLQGATSSVEGITDVFHIEVKRDDADSYHALVKRSDRRNVSQGSSDYQYETTSESDGFWEYRNGSIFLFPKPSEAVTDGLRIYGLHTLADLAVAGAESTIFPDLSFLRPYHYVVGLLAIPFSLRHRYGANDPEVLTAQGNAELELNNLVSNLVSVHAPTVIYNASEAPLKSRITS